MKKGISLNFEMAQIVSIKFGSSWGYLNQKKMESVMEK